jgi:hypothetical protein
VWRLIYYPPPHIQTYIPKPQCRDTVIIRPHPGVWRVVHGLGMLYLMCLAVLLVHDKAGARYATIYLFILVCMCVNIYIYMVVRGNMFTPSHTHYPTNTPPTKPQHNNNRELVRTFVPDIGPTPLPRSGPGDAFDCSINAGTIWRQLTEIWYVFYTCVSIVCLPTTRSACPSHLASRPHSINATPLFLSLV